MAIEIIRLVAVVALLGAAAAIATPKGRLPLPLRGLARLLGRESTDAQSVARVRPWRRLLALLLVLIAAALALGRI